MRVLHVFTLYSDAGAFGGPASVAVNVSAELRARKVDAELVALWDGDGDPPASVNGVAAHLFRPNVRLPALGFSGLLSIALLDWIRRSARTFDVAHVHMGRDLTTLLAACMIQAQGVRSVIQSHGMITPTRSPLRHIVDTLLTRPTLARAASIVSLTPTEERDLIAIEPTTRHKMLRIANGVQSRPPHRRSLPATPTVLFMARLHPRKQPEVFLAACEDVLSSGVHAKFVIAGPDGGGAAAVRRKVEELRAKFGASVEYAGPIPPAQAIDALASADVYVLPSIAEPFPMTVLEALSVGTPVVCTEESGVSSYVKESPAVLLVKPNVRQISDGIRAMIAHQASWERASLSAFDLASSVFDIGRVVASLVSTYEVGSGNRPI